LPPIALKVDNVANQCNVVVYIKIKAFLAENPQNNPYEDILLQTALVAPFRDGTGHLQSIAYLT
jgi:hypothetical protein